MAAVYCDRADNHADELESTALRRAIWNGCLRVLRGVCSFHLGATAKRPGGRIQL